MAGLLNKQAPKGEPEMQRGLEPGMQQEPQGAMQDEESNVSPEEQQEYDRFVTNGMKLMYSEQVMPQILQSIEEVDSPIEGLANAVATVVMRLDDSAEQQGQEISGDVKFHGAVELLEQMAELAEEAGAGEFSEQDLESALFMAMDVYRTAREQQGKLPKEEIAQDMQMLMEADQQGRLDEVVPGASEYAKRAPKGESGGLMG